MATQYTHSVTIAVPEVHISDANQLALTLGESASDDQTFTSANWQDADGNLYAVCSTVAKPVFVKLATSPLEAPAHAPDVDIEAATRAQMLVVLQDRTEGDTPVTAGPDRIAAILDDRHASAQEHITTLGITQLTEEEIHNVY